MKGFVHLRPMRWESRWRRREKKTRLDMLLHYERWGILLSSAVFDLRAAAANNNEKAVDFLIAVIEDPKDQALWSGASQGLVGAATKGNAKAKAALDQFEANGGSKGGA